MKRRANVTVVIPVKPWSLSKSRLDVGPDARSQLACAFTLDVLEAVSRSSQVGEVVIITAEQKLTAVARGRGMVAIADRPMLSPDGLNRAVDSGRWWAARRHPDTPVLIVPADLPALTGDALDTTIGLMSDDELAFIPDAIGRGTTLYWARSPRRLKTAYGPNSAVRHSAQGARAVSEADARTRWDVDTAGDLVEARRLGVGVHTETTLNRLIERPPART